MYKFFVKGIGIILCLNFIVVPICYSEDNNHAQCLIDYNLGKYTEALRSCLNSASSPNIPDKQISNYLLGEIYSYGKGNIVKNMEKALQYYKLSAIAGYPPAKLIVAHIYSNRADKITLKSIQWYLSAGKEKWDGAAYSLYRASQLFSNINLELEAYKCLYASKQLGYKLKENKVKISGFSLPDDIKKKVENEVTKWISEYKKGIVHELINLEKIVNQGVSQLDF